LSSKLSDERQLSYYSRRHELELFVPLAFLVNSTKVAYK